MTELDALPDFQASQQSGAATIFAGYARDVVFFALPSDAIATVSGTALSLVRRSDQAGSVGDYAILDLKLALDYPLDAALLLARAQCDSAVVNPAAIDCGFTRLTPGGPDVSLPADATTPMPLDWSTAVGARWTTRLEASTGELIKGALLKGASLFGARVEFTVRGVASRVQATAHFSPAALLADLFAGANDRRIAITELAKRLSDGPATLKFDGAASALSAVETLAERLSTAYGALAPNPDAGGPPCFSFPPTLPTDAVDWDLSIPTEVARGFVLGFDPLKGLRNIQDRSSLIHEVTVPPLVTGFQDVLVAANLPASRIGVPAIGARIVMPPAPPDRPSGIDMTLTFTPPDNSQSVTLQLGPNESLNYDVICFAIVAAGASVAQLEAPPRHVSGGWLRLQPDDFPLRFAHIVASDRLLQQASISGALTYTYAGRQARQSISLQAGQGDVAVASPAAAQDAILHLTATSGDGASATCSAPAQGAIRLDLPSFGGYGPHRISISCRFAGDEAPLVIELSDESGARQGEVMLAPSAPAATWGYVANSPFHTGYRFRVKGGAWSAPIDWSSPLELSPDGSRLANVAPAPDPPSFFEIDGVQFHLAADQPGVLSYVPAAATPELDPSGKPTLSIFKTPQMTRLQLGAHFALSENLESALIAKIAAAYPQLATAKLRPAPIKVTKASVRLADEQGSLTELGASSTSAFPPYAAIFSLPLSAGQAAQATSALGGRRGVLFVDYEIIAPDSGQQLTKHGDVASWFEGTEGLSHVRVLG